MNPNPTVSFAYLTLACPIETPIAQTEGDGGIEAPYGVQGTAEAVNRWKSDFKRFIASTRELETQGLLQQNKEGVKHFLTAGLPVALHREVNA